MGQCPTCGGFSRAGPVRYTILYRRFERLQFDISEMPESMPDEAFAKGATPEKVIKDPYEARLARTFFWGMCLFELLPLFEECADECDTAITKSGDHTKWALCYKQHTQQSCSPDAFRAESGRVAVWDCAERVERMVDFFQRQGAQLELTPEKW
eukprot:Sspe_Gene.118860::Locus_113318_Transcript_1_1_Confidence_1.000_Length_524::g.118860::m.118860